MTQLRKNLIAVALPFAHLLGLSSAAASEEDDDGKPVQRADESDEDFAKRCEDEDKKQKDGESDEDYAKRMKAAEGDDPKKGEGDEEKEQAIRANERARCSAIFAAPAAGVRPDLAAQLAFQSDMSSADAIKLLTTAAAGGAPAKAGLAAQMSKVRVPVVGTGGQGQETKTVATMTANSILAAARKARGET